MSLSIRDYICLLQRSITSRLRDYHRIRAHPSEHTGVFLDEKTKVASIGVHVSHRLTLHGLAMNVTPEPKRWFDQVIACGLADVNAGSLSDASVLGNEVSVEDEAVGLVDLIVKDLNRETEPLVPTGGSEGNSTLSDDLRNLRFLVEETEGFAKRMPAWPSEPKLSRT